MLRHALTAVVATALLAATALARPPADSDRVTPDEAAEARRVARRFADLFAERGDFGAVVDELYVRDFARRFVEQSRAEVASSGARAPRNFVPGLEYAPSALDDATEDDWRRFYLAANGVLLRGLVASLNASAPALLKGKTPAESSVRDMYPRGVRRLFDDDPILRNFVERRGDRTPVASAADMRRVTTLLERALAVPDEAGRPSSRALTTDAEKAVALIASSDLGAPEATTLREAYFGYPPGTRVVRVVSLMYELLLAREDGELRVVWAEPYAGD